MPVLRPLCPSFPFRAAKGGALILLLAAALAGCGSSADTAPLDASVLTHQDCEGLLGWVPEHPSLSSEKAHSGRYSLKVGPDAEYSLSFARALGQMTNRKPKKIKLSGWFYRAAKDANASLVLQVERPNTPGNVLWEALALDKEGVAVGKWVRAEKDITLPETIEFNDVCKLYVWRNSSQNVFADDLELRIVE